MGRGRDVRCGFWDKAASIALDDEGGVIRWISSEVLVDDAQVDGADFFTSIRKDWGMKDRAITKALKKRYFDLWRTRSRLTKLGCVTKKSKKEEKARKTIETGLLVTPIR